MKKIILITSIVWFCFADRSQDDCQSNEVFIRCGSCEGTCKTPVITECPLACRPARCECQSSQGYVRAHDGACISVKDCDTYMSPFVLRPRQLMTDPSKQMLGAQLMGNPSTSTFHALKDDPTTETFLTPQAPPTKLITKASKALPETTTNESGYTLLPPSPHYQAKLMGPHRPASPPSHPPGSPADNPHSPGTQNSPHQKALVPEFNHGLSLYPRSGFRIYRRRMARHSFHKEIPRR